MIQSDLDYHAAPKADIIAEGRSGQRVLLVETKRTAAAADAQRQLKEYLVLAGPSVPFAMIVDPDRIVTFGWDGKELHELAVFDTAAILETYDPEYGNKRIFDNYMNSLVEAWLRDLAYRWKSTSPPGVDVLRKIGLLNQLEGGTTRSEVSIRGAALS